MRWPEGPGLRVDGAIESGSTVSAAYDSLVAKLMAHGEDRDGAVARLARALRALELDGLETNRELLGAVLDDAAFRRGEADVHYLENRPDLRDATLPAEARRRHGAAVAFCLLERAGRRAAWFPCPPRAGATSAGRCTPTSSPMPPAPWRSRPPRRTSRPACSSTARGRSWARPPRTAAWSICWPRTGCGGATACASRPTRPRSAAPRVSRRFTLRTEDDAEERGGIAGECRAPLPGAVTKVLVAVGDAVAEGDGLVVLEAMKMEHTLRANGDGTVAVVECAPGQQVDVNDLLVTVEPT